MAELVARFKPLKKDGGYRVLCGFRESWSGRDCGGVLGYVGYHRRSLWPAVVASHERDPMAEMPGRAFDALCARFLAGDLPPSSRLRPRSADADPGPSIEQLLPPRGFYFVPNGDAYELRRRTKNPFVQRTNDRGQRGGRRAIPMGLRMGSETRAARRIIGSFPTLPAIIICYDCPRRNLVERPVA